MKSRADGGFVLVDALLASALLAFVGTVALTMAMSAHERDARDLNRSVGLIAMQSLAKQFTVLGNGQRSRLDLEDELFRYQFDQVSIGGHGALTEWQLTAAPLSGGETLHLSFLAL